MPAIAMKLGVGSSGPNVLSVDDLGSVDSDLADALLVDHVKEKMVISSPAHAPPKTRKALPLRVRDRTDPNSNAVLMPNAPEPFSVDNDMVEGRAILKVRTADKTDTYAPYFAGKQRMFEIMIEGRIKDIAPHERVYMGIETKGPIKLSGFFTKATAKVVLALISSTVQHAHCTLGNEKQNGQLVFPLDLCVDRLAVTPPDEVPPAMGVDMYPDKFSRDSRPALKHYNTEDTYSFSLHSMYVDLVRWQLCNLPGVGSVSLDTFLAKGQPLYFVGFAMSGSKSTAQQEKRYLFKFELENDVRQK